MRLFLAACLVLIFATQVAADAVACPDQCRQEAAQSGDDCGNATSACVFCAGGAEFFVAGVAVTRVSLSLPVSEPEVIATPRSTVNVPDRPPRLA